MVYLLCGLSAKYASHDMINNSTIILGKFFIHKNRYLKSRPNFSVLHKERCHYLFFHLWNVWRGKNDVKLSVLFCLLFIYFILFFCPYSSIRLFIFTHKSLSMFLVHSVLKHAMPLCYVQFSTKIKWPLLQASCRGEGRCVWRVCMCAPFCSSSSMQPTLPDAQQLNKGVTPSIVAAFTCRKTYCYTHYIMLWHETQKYQKEDTYISSKAY